MKQPTMSRNTFTRMRNVMGSLAKVMIHCPTRPWCASS
jgi:hypothetical protein